MPAMLHYGGESRKARFNMPTNSTPRPLEEFDIAARRAVRLVLTDIDDTLTTDGRLTAAAYAAMERLHDAGIAVAPITGRPAGWCDHIARMWPVAGVVGENGAFYYCYDRLSRRMRRVHAQDDATRARNRDRLAGLAGAILAAVPGAAIAADQFARETDLAIDFCEDVPPLPPEDVARIVALFEAAGATVKVSSIHVNGWFGDYDKLTMTRRFLAEVMRLDAGCDNRSIAFIGDSPNDAPMWAFFANGIGVANVLDFAGRLPAEPSFVTTSRAGEGFVELADALLGSQKAATSPSSKLNNSETPESHGSGI